jgi:hypothetical protein
VKRPAAKSTFDVRLPSIMTAGECTRGEAAPTSHNLAQRVYFA